MVGGNDRLTLSELPGTARVFWESWLDPASGRYATSVYVIRQEDSLKHVRPGRVRGTIHTVHDLRLRPELVSNWFQPPGPFEFVVTGEYSFKMVVHDGTRWTTTWPSSPRPPATTRSQSRPDSRPNAAPRFDVKDVEVSILSSDLRHVRCRQTKGEILEAWSRGSFDVLNTVASLAGQWAPEREVFWECAPMSHSKMGDAFEFVVMRAPGLAGRPPDTSRFERNDTWRAARAGDAVSFPNLSGDTHLVTLKPSGFPAQYTTISTFARSATDREKADVMREVARITREKLRDGRPVWVSTEGSGEAWLHVRIANKPKYYKYHPYTRAP